MAVPLLAMAGGKILGGLGSALMGGSAARRARRRQARLERQIAELEGSRVAITNPYAAADSILSNPFANLTVADQAAQMQAQQTDLALASTLDTLRATGAGGGGATALAQAALQSKQGVAASIQQQEAQNERLRAQGEARLQQQLFQADARGKQFVFEQTDRREMQKLNRLSALAGAASQQAAAAQSVAMGGIGQALGGIGSAIGGGFKGGKFSFENMTNAVVGDDSDS
jgi:hypothetical protein